MFFKNCPFCNENVDYVYNSDDKLYTIKCDGCSKNGIIVSISHSDLTELQNKWNKRVFDDVLLNDTEYSIKMLSFFNGTLKNKEDISIFRTDKYHKEFDSFNISEDIFGYMVMPNGDVIICDDEHSKELLKYLGIDDELNTDEIISIAVSCGIIRISKQAKCLMFDLVPNKINKAQITSLIKFLVENSDKLNYIKTFCVYKNGGTCARDIEVLDTLNDLILYLDGIK